VTALVLLGAGSSFGSVDAHFGDGIDRRTPPLASKLFSELEAWDGYFRALPGSIKENLRDDFESGMAKFYEHSGGDVMTFHRKMAHFFALFRPAHGSIFRTMLKTLGPERVIYSSLNYDLLFEQSAQSLGLRVASSPERGNRTVSCLKLHGSANFWPHMPGMTITNGKIFGNYIDIEAPVRPLDRQATLIKCKKEDSIAPAIAMFAEGKPIKVCPKCVEQQQKWWGEVVAVATKIFVVGVRVHPVDAHIWGVIGGATGRMTYFGRDGDRSAFSDWKRSTGKKNAFFELATFEESVPRMKRTMNFSLR
jgi:hypothetical protein